MKERAMTHDLRAKCAAIFLMALVWAGSPAAAQSSAESDAPPLLEVKNISHQQLSEMTILPPAAMPFAMPKEDDSAVIAYDDWRNNIAMDVEVSPEELIEQGWSKASSYHLPLSAKISPQGAMTACQHSFPQYLSPEEERHTEEICAILRSRATFTMPDAPPPARYRAQDHDIGIDLFWYNAPLIDPSVTLLPTKSGTKITAIIYHGGREDDCRILDGRDQVMHSVAHVLCEKAMNALAARGGKGSNGVTMAGTYSAVDMWLKPETAESWIMPDLLVSR